MKGMISTPGTPATLWPATRLRQLGRRRGELLVVAGELVVADRVDVRIFDGVGVVVHGVLLTWFGRAGCDSARAGWRGSIRGRRRRGRAAARRARRACAGAACARAARAGDPA